MVQFTKAVESKQVAQQDAERARFVVMKADQVGDASLLTSLYGSEAHLCRDPLHNSAGLLGISESISIQATKKFMARARQQHHLPVSSWHCRSMGHA